MDGNDLDKNVLVNLYNCTKVKVVLIGKFSNFMLSRCKRVQVFLQECIALGEVINCDDIKVNVETKLPTVSVEKSNGVEIICTKESKTQTTLRTTASQSVSFSYPKEEGEFNPSNDEEDPNAVHIIPETYIVKLVNGKLKIEANDMSEWQYVAFNSIANMKTEVSVD